MQPKVLYLARPAIVSEIVSASAQHAVRADPAASLAVARLVGMQCCIDNPAIHVVCIVQFDSCSLPAVSGHVPKKQNGTIFQY